jgi:hypothetical protein
MKMSDRLKKPRLTPNEAAYASESIAILSSDATEADVQAPKNQGRKDTATEVANLFSADEIEIVVRTAQKVVKERFEILKDTAPGSVLSYLQEESCCTDACRYVDQLSQGPMTPNKVFYADLAVAVTRVWEAFTKTPEGEKKVGFRLVRPS